LKDEMLGTRSLTVKRDLNEIGPAADTLRTWLHGTLDEDGAAGVELSMVESLTNSILYGPEGNLEPIDVFLEITDTEVSLEIEDGLPPVPELFANAGARKLDFDPDDLQNIPVSGRGLSLIVVSMDRVEYRTVDGQVRLRMVRRRT
jgi:anti-sigma regulatory factor (Ser/Thr protein kinase)